LAFFGAGEKSPPKGLPPFAPLFAFAGVLSLTGELFLTVFVAPLTLDFFGDPDPNKLKVPLPLATFPLAGGGVSTCVGVGLLFDCEDWLPKKPEKGEDAWAFGFLGSTARVARLFALMARVFAAGGGLVEAFPLAGGGTLFVAPLALDFFGDADPNKLNVPLPLETFPLAGGGVSTCVVVGLLFGCEDLLPKKPEKGEDVWAFGFLGSTARVAVLFALMACVFAAGGGLMEAFPLAGGGALLGWAGAFPKNPANGDDAAAAFGFFVSIARVAAGGDEGAAFGFFVSIARVAAGGVGGGARSGAAGLLKKENAGAGSFFAT